MQPAPQLLPYVFQLGCHALAHGFPVHQKVPRLVVLPTDVSETQKVEGFRFSFSTLCPPLSGIAPKLD
jgi:hypothetical protein